MKFSNVFEYLKKNYDIVIFILIIALVLMYMGWCNMPAGGSAETPAPEKEGFNYHAKYPEHLDELDHFASELYKSDTNSYPENVEMGMKFKDCYREPASFVEDPVVPEVLPYSG